MAIEHLKLVMGTVLSSWKVVGPNGSSRSVSAAVRKQVLLSMVWQLPIGGVSAFKAVTTVVEETHLSRRQVQTALRSLVLEGFLRATSIVNGKPWRGLSNAYEVYLPLERHKDAQPKSAENHLDSDRAESRPEATGSHPGAPPSQAGWATPRLPIGFMGFDKEIDGASCQKDPREICPHLWAVISEDLWECALCHEEQNPKTA